MVYIFGSIHVGFYVHLYPFFGLERELPDYTRLKSEEKAMFSPAKAGVWREH